MAEYVVHARYCAMCQRYQGKYNPDIVLIAYDSGGDRQGAGDNMTVWKALLRGDA